MTPRVTGLTAMAVRAKGEAPAPEPRPYVYGAARGAPSRGRPERVLAHLKTMESITREERVQGEDGRKGRVTAKGALPRSPRNGLPPGRPYVYRGSGESLSGWKAAEALTGRAPAPSRPRPGRMAPEPARCPECLQPKPDHLLTCSQAPILVPSLEDEPREPDILDLIDEQVARRFTPADAEDRLRETHRAAAPASVPEAPAPPRRHRKCGYPIGSVGCKSTCGGGDG
jgi:hypothetical protein